MRMLLDVLKALLGAAGGLAVMVAITYGPFVHAARVRMNRMIAREEDLLARGVAAQEAHEIARGYGERWRLGIVLAWIVAAFVADYAFGNPLAFLVR